MKGWTGWHALRRVGVVFLLWPLWSAADDSYQSPAISIVIDDLGYNQSLDRRAIALPAAVALAFLPDAPLTRAMTTVAHQQGHEIFLHLPMHGSDEATESAMALTPDLDQSVIETRVDAALDQVPFASGVSNHQGSVFTADVSATHRLVLSLWKRRPLMILDSRTSADSQLYQVARQYKMPGARRDIFLDEDPSPEAMDAAFDALLELAVRRGAALGIAHVRSATLDMLESRLQQLPALGIRLVPVSDLIPLQDGLLAAAD